MAQSMRIRPPQAGDQPVPSDENPLKISEDMKQFLDANVNHGGDSLQQLHSLVRVVFRENALNFTYVPQTRTAIETFNNRGGNCVSFTFLFIAMARQLGLDARFREVDITPTWSRVGDIIRMSGHANAAVFIGSEAYVVDLFPRVDRIQLGGRIVSDERAITHYLSNRAVDSLGAGKPREAIEYLQTALRTDPEASFVWTNLGAAQVGVADTANAEKSYLQALKLDSSEMVAMSNLSALYQNLGGERESKQYAAKVRRFKQKNPYFHFGLGMQAYQAGDYKDAIQHYRFALKLKSVEHNFDLAMAKAYAKLGQIAKTTEYLRRAAKNAPDELLRVHYNEKLALLAARQPHS
jgi:cytochrome c-type biogenesis protein CcmH/NrfG